MKLWIAIVVLMFATVGHAGAAGGFYSGNTVLGWCEGEAVADKTMCMGYVAGIADITHNYDEMEEMNKRFCIPEGTGLGQIHSRVTSSLKVVEEGMDVDKVDASVAVMFSLIANWPC